MLKVKKTRWNNGAAVGHLPKSSKKVLDKFQIIERITHTLGHIM